MSTQTIDYAALADQARQQSAPKVDYAALAEQARQPAITSTPEQDRPSDSVGGGLLRRGWDVLKSIGGLAKPPEGNAENASMLLGPAGPIATRLIRGQMAAEKQAAPQVKTQFQAARDVPPGNLGIKALSYARAGTSALSMLDPFATGSDANVNRLEDEGRNKEAIGQGAFDIAALATGSKPGRTVIGKTVEAFPSRQIGESVKVLAKPVGKMALEGVKSIPGIGGAVKGARAFNDVLPGLRNAWAKPTPEVEAGTAIAEPAPAPYRMRGSQIQDATTVMPRRIVTDPARMLGEGTASGPVESEPETTITPLRATSPKAAQTEILRKAGVASPAATIKPMTRVPNADITPRPDLKFSGSHSGEEAAMNQLTENVTPDRLGINELRGIAQQRGIKVSPGDNHAALYRKIQDSLTPEEIEQFDQARIERMQPDYSLPPISRAAEQGGHAGNAVASVEEISRPGTNYVVSKSGQLTYHGKPFAPESTPVGSTHVTALPDGTLRVNAGPPLTEAQELALRSALPETGPRVPVSDADRENLLMRSITRARSAKAGDD